MLVRHNTKLLEQAVALQVKRSAIPMLEAEAAAHEKVARASGFRRLATGAAIAIAAIGIGIGVWLVLDRGHPPEIIADAPQPDATPKPPRDPNIQVPNPLPEDPPRSLPQPDEKTAQAPTEVPTPDMPPPPGNSPTPTPPNEPNRRTLDFTKFINLEIPFLGSTWPVSSGHHFNDENDPGWDRAWCYTERAVDGVFVKVDLASRTAPALSPLAPVAPPETLSSVGLNDDLALQLATKCEWLDGAKFASTDFTESPGRPSPQAPEDDLVSENGWDALGFDFAGMPLREITYQECRERCTRATSCAAITYNNKHRACFLKSDAQILIPAQEATVAVKPAIASKVQKSNLILAANQALMGAVLTTGKAARLECVVACAGSNQCVGFNYHPGNGFCTIFSHIDQVTKSNNFESGRKSVF